MSISIETLVGLGVINGVSTFVNGHYNRKAQAEQGRLNRQLQADLAAANIAAAAEQGELNRRHQADLAAANIVAAAAQGELNRQHQARLAAESLVAAAEQGELNRQHQADLTDRNIAAAATQGELERQHQARQNAINRMCQIVAMRLQDEMQQANDEKNFQRQSELAQARQEFERELAWIRFEQDKQKWEETLFHQNWPLRLSPQAFSSLIARPHNGEIPLQILVSDNLAPAGVADPKWFDAQVARMFTHQDGFFSVGTEMNYYTGGWKNDQQFREGTAPFQLLHRVLKLPVLALTVNRSLYGNYVLEGALWNGNNESSPTFATVWEFNVKNAKRNYARENARQNLELQRRAELPDEAFTPEQLKNMQTYLAETSWRQKLNYDAINDKQLLAQLETRANQFSYDVGELDETISQFFAKGVSFALALVVDAYRVVHLGAKPRLPQFLPTIFTADPDYDKLGVNAQSLAAHYASILQSSNFAADVDLPSRLALTAEAFVDVGAVDEARNFQKKAWDILIEFYGRDPYASRSLEHDKAIETLRALPSIGREKASD